MHFSGNYKPELVVNKKARPELCELHLDTQNKCLVATNGHSLVAISVDDCEADVSGPVSVESVKAARKVNKKDLQINANSEVKLSNGQTFPREKGLIFPDYKQVLPHADREIKYKITFNPTLLINLAKALGSEKQVTLVFADPDMPIIVKSPDNLDNIGILMPIRAPTKED